jgi:hypothetical protein
MVLMASAVAVIAALAVSGLIWMNAREDPAKTPTPGASPTAPAAPVEIKFDVSSYDPVGGSGFKPKGSAWATQTYKTTAFAGLKPGVGLVFDLGSAQKVASVSFDAETGPLTVELRSADQLPSGSSDGERVGKSVSASGKTTLDGSTGGEHRYWMIWVTKLASSDQCVKPAPEGCAVLSDLSVSAASS